MISFNWVITLPKHLTADQFDAWYLGIHTELAKVAHKIIRYSINRRVNVQPEVAHGDYFRIAQEYWADWDSMVECWNHTTGWALLGDGMVNMGLQPGTLPGIALTTHTQFDVAQPAQFSTFQRGYRRAGPTGRSRNSSPSAWPRTRPASRTGTPRPSAISARTASCASTCSARAWARRSSSAWSGTLPSEGQLLYDWNLELWFDSNEDAIAYLNSAEFKEKFAKLKDASTDTLAGLFRGQEMLMLNTALPHRDD